jgi:hypothetical protein
MAGAEQGGDDTRQADGRCGTGLSGVEGANTVDRRARGTKGVVRAGVARGAQAALAQGDDAP